MAKIKVVVNDYGDKKQFYFQCIGCGYNHAFRLKSDGGHHFFNGDLDNPTISPSLLENYPGQVCHSFIENGKIQYLSDCHHALAGQTIELPEFIKK